MPTRSCGDRACPHFPAPTANRRGSSCGDWSLGRPRTVRSPPFRRGDGADRVRTPPHRRDGVRRLLPYRVGFGPVRQGERNPSARRGSAAASIVAYALRITDVDPLAYALPFERFLNPERVSMPDIDVDLCYARRDEVIEYVIRRYAAASGSPTFARSPRSRRKRPCVTWDAS